MTKYFIALVAVLIIAVGVWMSVGPERTPTATEPIRIGALISQTGIAAQFGEMAKFGMDLAAEEINAQGGIDGRLVEILYEDDRTDPKAAAGLYQKFTTIDRVHAIIGSNFDFVTQPVFALAATGDTVIVTPSSPRIAGAFDTNAQSFTMLSDFSKIVRALEPYFKEESFNKMAIVRFESAFGAEIAKTLNELAQETGKAAVIDETYKQIGGNDFRTTVLKLKSAGVEVVFLDMIANDPATFVAQGKAIGFTPKYIIHTGLRDALAAEGADPKTFEGFTVLDWELNTDAFAKKFTEKYKVAPTNSANRAYDAVYVLAQAVAQASEKSEVAEYLTRTTFTTPNGKFSFTPDHAAASTVVELKTFTNGTFGKYR